MTPLLSDARLAQQATEGDQRAFAAIYKRYQQDLYRFCLSIVGRSEDAQEALQNTMVKALRSLPGEVREIQLKPWLYRVAHNESVDLLRKRREGPELDDSRASGTAEIAETVALRERLERLLADLDTLPERQRAALVMRELSGLDYKQIGEALDTSTSTARQTVYEARLNLQELEAGREMGCDQVTRQLSEADGRVIRRRDIQAHLRACPDCRAFRAAIDSRRQDLAALSPLPAAVAASILHGLTGGGAATSAAGAGVAASGIGAGAGKVAASSVALKAVATVAVAATVGVTVADRGRLIDVGLPGGSGGDTKVLDQRANGNEPNAGGPPAATADGSLERAEEGVAGRRESKAVDTPVKRSGGSKAETAAGSAPSPEHPIAKGNGTPPQPPTGLPEASRHGQEAAAAHKANGGAESGKTHRHTPPKASHTGRGAPGKHKEPPANAGPPNRAQAGGTGKSKGDSPARPQQSETSTQSSQPEAKAGGTASADVNGTGQKPVTSP
jgi:RNA polymerase sigma factor (sigma-70 family)